MTTRKQKFKFLSFSKTNISSDLQKNTHLYVSQHDQEQVAGLYGMCVIWHVMIIGRCRTGDKCEIEQP